MVGVERLHQLRDELVRRDQVEAGDGAAQVGVADVPRLAGRGLLGGHPVKCHVDALTAALHDLRPQRALQLSHRRHLVPAKLLHRRLPLLLL